MLSMYYLGVSVLALAGILFVAAMVVAIVYILRHPNKRSVQDLEAPLRAYMLDGEAQMPTEDAPEENPEKLGEK